MISFKKQTAIDDVQKWPLTLWMAFFVLPYKRPTAIVLTSLDWILSSFCSSIKTFTKNKGNIFKCFPWCKALTDCKLFQSTSGIHFILEQLKERGFVNGLAFHFFAGPDYLKNITFGVIGQVQCRAN